MYSYACCDCKNLFILHVSQMMPRLTPTIPSQSNNSLSNVIASSNQQSFDSTIIHTPRRAFNRPSSARGRIERVRSSSHGSADASAARSSSSQASGATTSPVCDTAVVAAPPKEYIETDVSELSAAISSARFDLPSAKLRIHVEYSAYLVSTGHSLRYDPAKYKTCFADLEQLVGAELKTFNVQVLSNRISFIGFSGPRPGSFEICLVWDDAHSKNISRFCNIFSKLETRR
jgi:hypothetical protein